MGCVAVVGRLQVGDQRPGIHRFRYRIKDRANSLEPLNVRSADQVVDVACQIGWNHLLKEASVETGKSLDENRAIQIAVPLFTGCFWRVLAGMAAGTVDTAASRIGAMLRT